MPGFDGTGPYGAGPMTGGARGYCAMPAGRVPNRPFVGRGFGRGRGRGGWRHMYWATGLPGWARAGYGYPVWGYPYAQEVSAKEEMDMLKEEAESLKQELNDIHNRISTLEKAQAKDNG